MRAVIQRVARAAVTVNDERVAEIDAGLLVLLCIEKGDDEDRVDRAARKIARLRCFADDRGRMHHDLAHVNGAMLVVPQFTLAADLHAKGRRPGFDGAAPPDLARPLVQRFLRTVSELGIPASTGVFGAHMDLSLVNDGPVTLVYEERDDTPSRSSRPDAGPR